MTTPQLNLPLTAHDLGDRIAVRDATGVLLATVLVYPQRRDVAEYVARLIVAAPGMLDALDGMMRIGLVATASYVSDEIVKARAAIAAVKGES